MKNILSKLLIISGLLQISLIAEDSAISEKPTRQIYIEDEAGAFVQIDKDGTKTIKKKDGTTVIIKPDGTKFIQDQDGTTIQVDASGNKSIKKTDGTTIEIKSNR
jgi:hypothetical protein